MGVGAPRARPPERSGDRGAPRASAKGGPRGRTPPGSGKARHGRVRRSGAGIVGPRERRREGGRGGESPPDLVGMLERVATYLSFVRFSHTVFALPFALAGGL